MKAACRKPSPLGGVVEGAKHMISEQDGEGVMEDFLGRIGGFLAAVVP